MKNYNYNKILEAVNRGILLALDDFNDEEQVLNIKSKQVLNRDYTKEYLDLMKDVVDLGLPSGTLWCKYNLDVDPSKLSKAEDWYGNYYAWGELKPTKTNKNGNIYFYWSNYKFGQTSHELTKYCSNPKYGLNGFTDNLTKLLPEDDGAYLTKKLHNYKFHIPSKELYEELLKYTNNYWINNYDPNKTVHNPKDDKGIKGLNGRIFEGKNGNQIFIPAAGYRYNFVISFVGSNCCSWSSSLHLDHPNGAHYLYFNSDGVYPSSNYRYFGFSIRPIIKL